MSTLAPRPSLRTARFGPFALDGVDSVEISPEPSPSQLRAALLLTYAGLLLSLSALF